MIELRIDPEFRDVLPSKEADYLKLEKTVLEDGRFTDPFITWNGFLIDGHTRYRIMQNHPEVDLHPYEKKMDDIIPNRDAVIVWIGTHQESRRNLNDFEWAEVHKKVFDAQKRSVGQHIGNQYTAKMESVEIDQFQNPSHRETTATTLAKDFGISVGQMKHSVRIGNAMEEAERLVPGAKEVIKSGETKAAKSTVEDLLTIENETERKEYVEDLIAGKKPKAENRRYATKEIRERYNKVDQLAHQVRSEAIKTTFDDVMRLLNIIEDDFLAKVERTIEGNHATLSVDERWPDAIEGYFDTVIADITNMKRRILK